jgi:hypothetical protein
MPRDYGRWFHNRENIRPSRPHTAQHDPKEPIEGLSTGRRRFRFSTATCWRRASTSNETSRGLRKNTAKAASSAPIISITNQL